MRAGARRVATFGGVVVVALATGMLVAGSPGGAAPPAPSADTVVTTTTYRPLPSEYRMAIADASVIEGDAGITLMRFRATVTPTPVVGISFHLGLTRETVSASDYVQPPYEGYGFAPGHTETEFMIKIVGDTVPEANETFRVSVVSAYVGTEYAWQLGGQARGTIVDDDAKTVGVRGSTVAEPASGKTRATISIELSEPAAKKMRIKYRTLDRTATQGKDYVAARGSVVVKKGATHAQVAVWIKADQTAECTEHFDLLIAGAPADWLVVGQGRTLITDQDCDE